MFGYFALGVLLGLLIGAVLAAILVLVLLKCCDKGKVAPYYTVSPGTTGYICTYTTTTNHVAVVFVPAEGTCF